MLKQTLEAIQSYLLEKMYPSSEYQLNGIYLDAIQKDVSQKEGLCITLLHVEEETSRKQQSPFRYAMDERDGKKKVVSKNVNPDVCLNLYVLITSHAQDYGTSLAQISDVIYWMNNINYRDDSNEISANGLHVEVINT